MTLGGASGTLAGEILLGILKRDTKCKMKSEKCNARHSANGEMRTSDEAPFRLFNAATHWSRLYGIQNLSEKRR